MKIEKKIETKVEKNIEESKNRIAVVRISGDVKIREEARETFRRLGLTRKYSCIVLDSPVKSEIWGMVIMVKDFIAYGELDDETFKKLVEIRGKKFKSGKNPNYPENKPMQVFRLHPPRKGIDSKLHFGIKKGVLGNNGKDINKLVERML